MDDTSDRPLECSGCKKPICFIYKEIENNLCDTTHMCQDCPILQKKLHGNQESHSSWENGKQALCCSLCHTSFGLFRSDQRLGCAQCYVVFEKLLIEALKDLQLLPEKLLQALEKAPHLLLHLGHSPHQQYKNLNSLQMTDLTKALQEALSKENYEQAASLRDQIKKLQEGFDEPV